MTAAFASLDGRHVVWEPLPRQGAALACPAFETLFGGAKGGGKSDWLVACPIPVLQFAHQQYMATGRRQHRVRWPIFRKNLDDLRDIIGRTKEIYPVLDPEMGEKGFHQNEKRWTFTSGASIELCHLDGPEDHRRWHGQELVGLGIDQAEEIAFDVVAFLMANVRTANPLYRKYLRICLTANPGGRHGDWIYKRYVQPHEPGNKIIEEHVENRDGSKRTVTRAFVPSSLVDNPYLNSDGSYEANLRATLPEHLLKQYLEGDWHVVIGAYFASRVIPHKHGMTWSQFLDKYPGGIPESWELRYGLDWGSTAPAALVLGARDGDGRVWLFDELYRPGETGSVFGEAMHRLWTGQDWSQHKKWAKDEAWGAIDSQAWGKYGSEGMVAADGIASKGFRVFPAQKDRKAGIAQWLERLQIRTDGLPGVVIIKDRCPNLWRTLQTVRVDPKNPDDYDKTDEGHAVDAGRFLLMEWPTNGAEPQPTKEEYTWDRVIRAHQDRARMAAASVDRFTTGYDT